MNRHTISAITALSIGLLGVVLLAGCGGAAPGRTTEEPARAEAQGVSVTGYCEAFARQYAENHGLAFQEDSARTAAKSDVMQFLSNVFQPADYRFTGGYACHFQASAGEQIILDYAVDIVLTNTREFAEHTQWEQLQIVPIARVVDEARNRSGYAVFKGLDAPGSADTEQEKIRGTDGGAVELRGLERIGGNWYRVYGARGGDDHVWVPS